jgi:hypothetical protein
MNQLLQISIELLISTISKGLTPKAGAPILASTCLCLLCLAVKF